MQKNYVVVIFIISINIVIIVLVILINVFWYIFQECLHMSKCALPAGYHTGTKNCKKALSTMMTTLS